MIYIPTLLALLLIGCTPQSIVKPEIVEVKVPVFSCPKPPDVQPIYWYTKQLTDKSSDGDTVQAYVFDKLQCEDRVKQYESILDKYREMK